MKNFNTTRTLLTLLLVIPCIAMGQKYSKVKQAYYSGIAVSGYSYTDTLYLRSVIRQQQSHIADLERTIMALAKENEKLRKLKKR